jgi:acylphosphatase
MLVARRFRVTGRVQGVGFRYFTEAAARAEGLSGWVQNQPDGAVEVVVEGDRESVHRFEAKLRRGPAGARIDRVDVNEDVPSGRAGEFIVHSSYGRDE